MKQIEEIVQTLMVKGALIEEPGLFCGKTGIAVFLCHYARHTGIALFQEKAKILIEEVQNQITDKTPMRYDKGISGIGVAVEYLLQNAFLEAEDNDIFEAFDERLYLAAMHDPYSGFSLESSLTGWGRYFIYRLRGTGHKDSRLREAVAFIARIMSKKIKLNKVTEKERPDVYRFFYDLTSFPEYAGEYSNPLQQCRKWNCISQPDTRQLFPYMNTLQRLFVCQHYFNLDLSEAIGQEWKNWEASDSYAITDNGLLNGWAGEGMLYLTHFHNLDHSWFKIL